jgi:hypothetical protein
VFSHVTSRRFGRPGYPGVDDALSECWGSGGRPTILVDAVMGACCSRCCRSSDGDDGNGEVSAAELELQAQADLKSLCIVRGMSAPTIEIEDRTKVRCFDVRLTICLLKIIL